MAYVRRIKIRGTECTLSMDDTHITIEGKYQYSVPISSITAIKVEPTDTKLMMCTEIHYQGGTIPIDNDLSDLATLVREINPSTVVTIETASVGEKAGGCLKEVITGLIGLVILNMILKAFGINIRLF